MSRILVPGLALAACLVVPPPANAQPPVRGLEINGSLAAMRVFRVEDQSFGTVLNPGIGAEWRPLSRLAMAVEANTTHGLEPRTVACQAGVVCVGAGREGVLRVTVVSVMAAWYLGSHPRAQPYLLAGADVLWSRTVNSTTVVSGNVHTVSESEASDRGTGVAFGAGLRVPLAAGLVIRPEWRLYSGVLLGRENLTAMRASVAVGYPW
jgi:opacity protein-like surface antigen